ncbi:MAG: phosphoribosylamine--glycine ligase [Deltaproteobacteria bacterium]|nr:phosphoribosylamine--glycine ligase [Deltaproteobacteria bacterium]
MNILVIGSGGREHAFVWSLSRSKQNPKIFCAPGNPGIAALAECIDIQPSDGEALVRFAKEKSIDITLVGPEMPLAEGLVDLFKVNHLPIFGPTKAAALLESSKIHSKEFCDRHHIPQANYKIFDNALEAKESLSRKSYPLVIKANGLAFGKGVSICQNEAEAILAIDKMLVEKCFGEAGCRIVIEEFLKGEEASFIAVVDGKHVLPLSSARDYKRLLNGDKGPNTGGMGSISPATIIHGDLYEKVMERIMIPAVRGMAAEGAPFVGFLYAGLMIENGDPHLLEFNVRMGDPEAQVILPRLKTDLVSIIEAALAGRLGDMLLSWETKISACVVMASGGYPEEYETGFPIQGLEELSDISGVLAFHSGTKKNGTHILTAGGRVLGITGLGNDLQAALDCAYEAVSKISWEGCQYRTDIGRNQK